MRATIDTNVVVSASLTPNGPPAQVIRAWRQDVFEWVCSPILLEEYRRVLRRPGILRHMIWTPQEVDEFFADFATRALILETAQSLDAVPRDPDDNRVLEAAIAGEADYIVSGDRDITALNAYAGIPIVSPARFVAILAMETRL